MGLFKDSGKRAKRKAKGKAKARARSKSNFKKAMDAADKAFKKK